MAVNNIKPLVSIIIPIYNSSKYIEKLLDSISKQTYKSLEVLLIDDGSKDDSLLLAKEYCSKFRNFKVFTQKHQGVSKARNFGISKANGTWLSFIDSDDELSPLFYERMVNGLKKTNIDMVVCKYTRKKEKLKCSNTFSIIDATEYFQNMMDSKLPKFEGYLWNKLFKKSIVKNNAVAFNEKVLVWEDMLFVEQYLLYSSKVLFLNDILYYYRQNQSSITNNKENIELDGSRVIVCNEIQKISSIFSKLYWQTFRIKIRNIKDIYKKKFKK